MRDKGFDKLVEAAVERVISLIQDGRWICYECGEPSVLERLEKLEQEVARHMRVTDDVEIVRCKDCKHCFVDGDNVRYNVCDLNHNKVQRDDWFCADGERRENDGTD